MIINAFAIRDVKANCYQTPFFSYNSETAKRDFMILLRRPEYLGIESDYELYALGAFDTESGCFEDVMKPDFIVGGVAATNG